MKVKPHYAVISLLALAVTASAWLLYTGHTIAAMIVLAIGFNVAAAVADLTKQDED